MNAPQPKVSIVLCCYNQESFVEKAIESALGQTYSNIEVVLMDNGSTDGSGSVISRYLTHPRTRVILHDQNEAVSKRLNEAIAASTGSFISVLYADDHYLPHKITTQMKCFSELPPDYGVVYGPGFRHNVQTDETFEEPSLEASGFVLEDFFCSPFGFNPISPLAKKECFLRYPFRENVFLEGEAIYIRMAMTYRFQYLPEPLVVMSEHPGNAGKAFKKTKALHDELMKALLIERDFPEDAKPLLKQYHGRIQRGYGWQCIRLGKDNRWARNCFIEAVQLNPKEIFQPKLLLGSFLSLMPDSVVEKTNFYLNQRSSNRTVLTFREDYS